MNIHLLFLRLAISLMVPAFLMLSVKAQSQGKLVVENFKMKASQTETTCTPAEGTFKVNGLNGKVRLLTPEQVNDICNVRKAQTGFLNYATIKTTNDIFILKKRRKKETKMAEEKLVPLALEQLLDKNLITPIEYDSLSNLRYQSLEQGSDNIYYQGGSISKNNPYHINGNPLTVFEVVVSNSTANTIGWTPVVHINDGGHYATAYSSQAIRVLQSNMYYEPCINGVYMEPNYFVGPGMEVRFLVAFSPISNNDHDLEIGFENTTVKFHIAKQVSAIQMERTYYPIDLECKTDGGVFINPQEAYNIISSEETIESWADGESFHIEKSDFNKGMTIISIIRENRKVYFVRTFFNANNYLNLESNTRKSLTIQYSKVELDME